MCACKLGSPVIRIFAGKASKKASRDEEFKRAVSGMKQACDYAGSKGVFLGIENHGYLTETGNDVLRIVDAVDHDWFGVNLDTGNFRDDPYDSIAKTVPHAVVCQVKATIRNPETGKKPLILSMSP